MTTRFRWLMPTALFLILGAGLPVQAAASCLGGYYECLNDSWDTSGFERIMADVECFAGYVGCIRRLV